MRAALKHLFGEGYVARSPQAGPIRWLLATYEAYPHGYPFALDPRGDFVWVADTGALRRIRRGSLELDEVPIGEGVMPRSISVDTKGRAWAVLELEQNPSQGKPPWRAPSRGGVSYGLMCVEADLSTRLIARVPHSGVEQVSDSVQATSDGRILGPHAEGAALYSDQGQVLQILPSRRCTYWSPRAAVSPSGRWLCSLDEEGQLRIEHEGQVQRRQADFAQLLNLHIDDQGVVLAGGCREGWGLSRFAPGRAPERLSEDHQAALSPSGQRVFEARYGQVGVRSLGAEGSSQVLHELGMSRAGRGLFLDEQTLVLRTDQHTLAELDLSRV